MKTIKVNKLKTFNFSDNFIIIANSIKDIPKTVLTKEEQIYVANKFNEKKYLICLYRLGKPVWVYFSIYDEASIIAPCEIHRRSGNNLAGELSAQKLENITIIDVQKDCETTLCFLEGLILGSYVFDFYKKYDDILKNISLYSKNILDNQLSELLYITDSVYKCRNLTNQPASYLSTSKFKEEIIDISEKSGLKLDIFDEAKIATLKMGGLIAVNKGSAEPPFFAIAEWKPKNAVNKKPYIIIGKGITFDTGGYSIKTGLGMEDMKIDMSGAAVVISTLSAIALNQLPVHVIGLMPATDNTINEKAQLPGDIITMHNGKTVEVLSTDAEGRLILADALSYAQKYKPELVIDLATLTGNAHLALGKYGIFAVGKNHCGPMQKLKAAGDYVFERLVEFPLWDEYKDSLQSAIADLKNVGDRHAGAIIASKFLEEFTDYPWIHLDIAGPAFYSKSWHYQKAGGTGIGVRLLYHFFKQISS